MPQLLCYKSVLVLVVVCNKDYGSHINIRLSCLLNLWWYGWAIFCTNISHMMQRMQVKHQHWCLVHRLIFIVTVCYAVTCL